MTPLLGGLSDVGGFFTHVFDPTGFPRRWDCGTWSAGHGWLHVISDLGVWSAYVAIPLVLLYFAARHRHLPFRFIFVLFGAFILFCGTTHLMEAIIFWWPAYRLAGLIKLSTAIVSWATVIALVPITPRALAMKSPEALEKIVAERTAELNREIGERTRAERELREQRELLEVTLASIGDAVLTTDEQSRVVFLNAVASRLTGFTLEEARGQPLETVFRIVNERTREPVANPWRRVLESGTVVGLANHTLLISKQGQETPIDDSAAPIRDYEGNVAGAVVVFRDATSSREHVEAQERLAAIVQSSHDAIISQDKDGKIQSWNKGARDLFGYTAQEAVGRGIDLIVPADRRIEFEQSLARLRRGEPVEYRDTVRVHKDGTRLEVSSRISPIRDANGEVVGASKISHDISERKRGERTLRLLSDAGTVLLALADEKRMMERVAQLIVPVLADWCVVRLTGLDGRTEDVACAHADRAKVVLVETLAAHYPLDNNLAGLEIGTLQSGQAELATVVPRSRIDSACRDEAERRLIDQLEPRTMLVVPLVIRGRAVGTIQLVVSDSQRRYSSPDLAVAVELARRVSAALENARLYQELKETQRQKDDFLAMLAHELRNPLAAIQYANQIAALGDQPDLDAREAIDRQTRNLAHLIDDLLDVSRITRDTIRLKMENIDAATLVRRAVATVRPQADARHHTLAVELSPQPLPLYVDATRVEQILVNLLSNAVKYTGDRGRLSVRTFADDGQAVIVVKDDGVGISPDVLPRIFDLFTQADKSLDRSAGGLGIGLTVARRLAEMHRGTVSAASAGLGHGSEFALRLPLATAAPVEAAEISPLLPAAQPRKILVVDDNVDTARSVVRLLQWKGHQVRQAHDGQAAIAAARHERPDVILLDIGLPLVDGYTVARTLREDPQLDGVRLIALSGYGQPEDRRRSREAGFDLHLVKPVDFDELLAALT